MPLRLILEAAPDRPDLVARLLVDDGTFTITSTAEAIRVEYGDTSSEPERVARTNYGGFLEAGEGRISLEEFATRHLEIVDGTTHADAFLTLMSAAMTKRG